MSWYSAGTASVRNGSKVVTIAAGDLISNLVQPGDAFVARGGQPSEIGRLISATQLELVNAWGGGDADGLAYSIQPTTDYQRVLAGRLAGMVGDYQAVLDGPARGMFADGSAAAPGVRFAADQDTGLRRAGENSMALVSGGADALLIDGNRHIGVGTVPNVLSQSLRTLHLYGATGSLLLLDGGAGTLGQMLVDNGVMVLGTRTAQPLAFTTTAAERMRLDTSGNLGIGTAAPATRLHVASSNATQVLIQSTAGDGDTGLSFNTPSRIWNMGQNIGGSGTGTFNLYDVTGGAAALTVDTSRRLLVGVTSTPDGHIIHRPVSQNGLILRVQSSANLTAAFFGVNNASFSSASTAFAVGANTDTGRSISSSGTINANGADYAEYMVKASGCGHIAKGDVIGVDRDGKLTQSWAAAIAYMVKSTDPNLVGGDSWAQHLGARPEAPLYEAPVYDGPAEPVEAADGDAHQYAADRAAYDQAQAGYAEAIAAAEAAHAAAMTEHEATLAAWEADLEAARQTVDRIAYSGQVPVNVDADVLAAAEAALADGEAIYLVAVEKDGGIAASVVRESAMTLPLYMRRLGKVLAIRDGRPWMDVQHG